MIIRIVLRRERLKCIREREYMENIESIVVHIILICRISLVIFIFFLDITHFVRIYK